MKARFEPAFPVSYKEPQFPENPEPGKLYPMEYADVTHMGMSLRDYFAAKFMQGWMASWSGANPNDEGLRLTAKTAYEMADAMLLAREAP